MSNLKLFNTKSEYKTFVNNAEFIRPNVSYISDVQQTLYTPIKITITCVYTRDFNGTSLDDVDYNIFNCEPSTFSSMTVNGVEQQSVTKTMKIPHGDNVVRFTLAQGVTTLPDMCFSTSVLKSIKLSTGIISVGSSFLHNCDNVQLIDFPKTITEVGHDMLYETGGIHATAIFRSNLAPTVVGTDSPYAFTDANKPYRIIVPTDCANNYKTAHGWDNCATIIESNVLAD